MFDSGTRTLSLAILRRCAPLLLIQLALTLAFCFLIQDADLSLGDRSEMSRSDFRQLVGEGGEGLLVSILIVGVNLLFSVGTVIFQYSDSGQLRARFPVRVYLLPLSFRRLVYTHMVEGATMVALVMAIVAYTGKYFFESPYSVEQIACLGVLLFTLLQAWSIALAGSNRTLWGGVTLIALTFGGVALLRSEKVAFHFAEAPSGVLFTISSLFLLGSSEGVVRLSHSNRSRSFDTATTGGSGKGKSAAGKYTPFSSSFWAQAWYEWRVVGWMLPVLTLVLLVVYFVGVPLLTALFISATDTRAPLGEEYGERFAMHWAKNQQIVSTGLLTVAAGAGVLTGAYMFLVSGEWRRRSTFLRTRPMSTPRLASTRLVVLLASTALSTMLLTVVFIAIGEYLKRGEPDFETLFYIRQGYDHLPDALVLLFFIGSLFVIMWCGLWLVNLGAYLSTFGVALALSFGATLVVTRAFDADSTRALLSFLDRALVWATTFIWIGGCVWLYVQAHRLRVIPKIARPVAIAVWCICAVAFLFYGLGIRYYATYYDANGVYHYNEQVTDMSLVNPNAVPFTHPVDWVLWAGISLLPVLPVVSLPYRLELMRRD